MDRLADPQVWLDAATQIFYSFGLGFGGLIAFSSYNNIHNNCQRDAILISLCNWFTALFASSVIFAVLGFKATLMYENCLKHNMDIFSVSHPAFSTNLTQETFNTEYAFTSNVSSLDGAWKCSMEDNLNHAASGTGLAFIIFTQAIVEFGPSAPFWSIIFFLMLLSLGMGSEFGTIEGFTSSIYDLEPLPFITRKKWLTSGLICLVSCTVGILFVLGSGSYWVALFDSFSGSFPLITVALFECLAVAWVYGVDKFAADIKMMIGSEISPYWKIVWKYVAPFVVMALLAATLISKIVKPITYEAYNAVTATMVDRGYPWYGTLVALVLVFSSIGCIPGIAICRKLRILNWDYAKQAAAETAGYTQSTAQFIRSLESVDEDDSGHNSDEVVADALPYSDNPTEQVRFTLVNDNN